MCSNIKSRAKLFISFRHIKLLYINNLYVNSSIEKDLLDNDINCEKINILTLIVFLEWRKIGNWRCYSNEEMNTSYYTGFCRIIFWI